MQILLNRPLIKMIQFLKIHHGKIYYVDSISDRLIYLHCLSDLFQNLNLLIKSLFYFILNLK
jgi:hypothetical protein